MGNAADDAFEHAGEGEQPAEEQPAADLTADSAETGFTFGDAAQAAAAEAPAGEAAPSGEISGDGRNWFVIHCYSGYENKVRHNLEQRIESMGMKGKIFEIGRAHV